VAFVVQALVREILMGINWYNLIVANISRGNWMPLQGLPGIISE